MIAIYLTSFFDIQLIVSFFALGIQTPVCAVSGAKFLTESGWVDLRNSIDSDVPFRLFRDEGRTFLQVSISYLEFIQFICN